MNVVCNCPMSASLDLPGTMKLMENAVRYRRLADNECSTTLALAAALVSAFVGSTFIPYR
jgi:hypothetical protein